MTFDDEVAQRIAENATNEALASAAHSFMQASATAKYSYNFTWLGRPIIQYPQDMIAMQELVWRVQPDLIIETGVAHGGSLIFYASMLELLAACGGSNSASVVGVDIDIRPHNRHAIEAHPLSRRVQLIEGSSTDPGVVRQVTAATNGRQRVMICLDSHHTHDHVLAELEAYARLTSIGSYCVVFDTLIEDLATDTYPDRPWGRGNNPSTAVNAFLRSNANFVADTSIDSQLMITVASGGYLRRLA